MIGVAVMGAGHWGPNLIRNFDNHQDSRVHWVIDRDHQRLKEVKLRLPSVQVSDDPAVAIGDPGVDAVIVVTPTVTHHQFAKQALEARKHVLVEKPLAASVEQATELVDLADRVERVLMVGHVFVYNTAVRRVKQILDAGDIGRVYYLSMVRTNLGPIRTDVNAAWDLASHDIAVADYWLGSEPLAAAAVGGDWINTGIQDAVFVTVRYPEDVLVNLLVSWLNPRKARDVTVVGERRMLTFDDMDLSEPIRIYDRGVAEDMTVPTYADTFSSFRASIREGDVTIPKLPLSEPLLEECVHFLECIRTGERPLTGGPEGLSVVKTLEAIQRSMVHGGIETPV